MITKKQYTEARRIIKNCSAAIDTVKEYEKQFDLNIIWDKNIEDIFSLRAKNAILNHSEWLVCNDCEGINKLSELYIYIISDDYYEGNVRDSLLKIRNIGSKTMLEISDWIGIFILENNIKNPPVFK